MEEEFEPTVQSLNVCKCLLGCQAAEAINILFKNKIPINYDLNLDQISSQVNQVQRTFLSTLFSATKIFCLQSDLADFNEGFTISLLTQCPCEASESSFNKFQLLIIAKKSFEPDYFYFGFFNSKQELFTDKKVMICLKYGQKQQTIDYQPMNCDEIFEYVKKNIDTISIVAPMNDQISNSTPLQLPFSSYEGYKKKSSRSSIPIKSKLQKKLSQRSLPLELQNQNSINYFSLNQDAQNLRQYLSLIDEKIEIPSNLSKLMDNIPYQYSQHLLQGLLKNTSKNKKFTLLFYRFIHEISNPVGLQNRLFDQDLLLQQTHINEFPLPTFSMGSFDNQEQFFNNQYFQENNCQNSMDIQQHNDCNIQNQESPQRNSSLIQINENLNFFCFEKQEIDQKTRRLSERIKSVIAKNNLKPRSTIEMAKKFLQCKQNGTITLQTRPQELTKMRINVGKHYCQVLHPLFMEQLQQQNNNQSVKYLNNKIKTSVDKIKGLIGFDNQELPFQNQISAINQSISLNQFCKCINEENMKKICKVVKIEIDKNIEITTMIKYVPKIGCVYLYIQDFNHIYDLPIILPSNIEIKPQKIVDLLLRLKKQKQQKDIQGQVHYQPLQINSIAQLISSTMIQSHNDYLTVFYRQKLFSKRLYVMIKVVLFQTKAESKILLLRFQVISNYKQIEITQACQLKLWGNEQQ